jgi:DNA-binding XRE family transcriptional regulator
LTSSFGNFKNKHVTDRQMASDQQANNHMIRSFGYLIPWYFLRQHCTIKGMAKPSPTHAGAPVLTGLGAVIREMRAKNGLSQEALAVDADLDRSYMGGIERGEHNLTLINLQRIALALGTKPSKLLQAAGC